MGDEIWGSTSEFLNDPFECKIAYDFDLIKDKLDINSYDQDFVEAVLYTKEIARRIEQMNYIASFTRNNYENELMWAHYADQAHGFALEYEEESIRKLNNKLIIKDVNYIHFVKNRTEEIFNIISNYRKNGEIKIPYDMANEVNISKSDSWKMEKEVRFLLKKDDQKNHGKMCKIKPIALYIEKNCSDKDKYILYSIAYNKKIDLYHIEYLLKSGKYILNRRKIENDEIKESLNTFCFRKELLFLNKYLKEHGNEKIKNQ